MKNLYYILALTILSSFWASAQIPTITPQKQRYEIIGENVIKDNQSNKISLVVSSDNRFEKNRVYLPLGSTENEIKTSLKNLSQAISNPNTQFDLFGYTIKVYHDPYEAYVINTGKLANTDGLYRLNSTGITKAIVALSKKYGWDIGSYLFKVETWSYSCSLDVILLEYGGGCWLDLGTEDFTSFSDWLDVNVGDTLNDVQLAVIKDKIRQGEIKKDDDVIIFTHITNGLNVDSLLSVFESNNKPDKNIGKNPVISADMNKEKNEDEIFMVVQNMPQFPGGQAELFLYLSKNIRYPEIAKENRIEGRVLCQFVIEKDGTISNVEIVRSGGDESLDEEAVRVISSMPKWEPGKQKGKPVRVKYTVPVNFKL